MLALPITETMHDANLFGQWFAGATWGTWDAILKAVYALPMTETEIEVFKSVSGGRNPPSRRCRELWALCGRRSGKDSIASLIAAHTAIFNNFQDRLRPGEKATIACLACDRTQSAIVHKYTTAYFSQPLLADLIANETAEILELKNGCEIIIGTNSFRSIRGKTFALAILDEVCFFRDDNFANPDKAVYEAIMPSFATLDDTALLVGISTPFMRSGLAYEKWQQYFGKDNDDDILVINGPSTAFNPTIPQRTINAALARDPATAQGEWLGQWRDLESAFLPAELIHNAVDPGVTVRPPERGVRYTAFCDPAGGAGTDSFTAAIAHHHDGTAILDAIFESTPPFSPKNTTAAIAELFRQYRIDKAYGDQYANMWPVESFLHQRIRYEPAENTRSEIYQAAIPLFTSGRVRLLDHQKCIDQFAGLRRKVHPGGAERIDHLPNAHDDISNAVAGALTLCVTARRDPMVVHGDVLAMSMRRPANHWGGIRLS